MVRSFLCARLSFPLIYHKRHIETFKRNANVQMNDEKKITFKNYGKAINSEQKERERGEKKIKVAQDKHAEQKKIPF